MLEKLAAMIPRPPANPFLYHGIFAPHARDRPAAVSRARALAGKSAAAPGEERCSVRPKSPAEHEPEASRRTKHFSWAELLRRTFAIDVLACPGCGGKLRFLAAIEQRTVVEKILGHLNLPTGPPEAAPACQTAWLPGISPTDDISILPPID